MKFVIIDLCQGKKQQIVIISVYESFTWSNFPVVAKFADLLLISKCFWIFNLYDALSSWFTFHADSHWRIIRIYKSGNYINQMSKNELFTDYICNNYIYCLYTIRNLSALIGKTNELFRSDVIFAALNLT